ncbi:MAG: DUF6259 domain-containing protein, partial [Planctomycetota bacterium]|nr:DUF6259 domain-containing protein [Planctomycetota bacterium]
MRKLNAGDRIWLENAPPGESLWQLHVADAKGRIVDLEARHARCAHARLEGKTLALLWQDVRCAKSGAGPFDVRVEIKAAAVPNMAAWRLHVRNRSRSWTLWHILFPRLRGLKPGKVPEEDVVIWPEMWGRHTVGWDKMSEVFGGCGGYGKHSMQFMGFTSHGRTFYLGAHDPHHWQKMMFFHPGKVADAPRRGAMHFLLHPSGMTEAGNGYEQTYDIMAGEIAGDWFAAAKFYAAFARQQAWASESPAYSFRGKREEREILLWEQATINPFPSDRVETVNDQPPAKWLAKMKALRQRLKVRMAVHFYNWHQTPFDTNYPEYFPAKRGFKELAAELKAAGIAAMPYINGRLWDQAAA